MKKLKLFLDWSYEQKLLFFEAFFMLAWGRLFKFRSFHKVAGQLGIQMEETSYDIQEEKRKQIQQISLMTYLAANYTLWESECLVKAYAAIKMLRKRGIDSTLYLGTNKDKDGKLIAHAWVRSGPYYITGYEGMEHFTVVATFASHASLVRSS